MAPAAPPVVPSPAFNQQQRQLAAAMLRSGTKEATVLTALKEAAKKCYDCDYDDDYCYEVWLPYGGATSWDEIDAYEQAQAARAEAWEISYQFERIVSNIFSDDSIDLPGKAARVQSAASELAVRTKAQVPAAMQQATEIRVGDEGEKAKGGGGRRGVAGLLMSLRGGKAAEPAVPTPVAPTTSGFRAFKQADGTWRWLAVHSNNFRDVDGEVFPDAANREWVQRVDAKEAAYPELWLWHTPGTRFGVADFVDVTTEGFVLSSGTIDAGKEAWAERLAEQGEIGVSHGFHYDTKDRTDNEVRRFDTFEISPLPLGRAANQITGFVAGKELDMTLTSPEKRTFLVGIMGEDGVKALETTLQGAASKAAAAGIDFKEVMAEIATPAAPAPTAIAETGAVGTTDVASLVTAAVTAAMQPVADQLAAIAQRTETMETAVKELQAGTDEKVANLMRPRNDPARAGFVASTSGPTARKDSAEVQQAEAAKNADGLENVPSHLRDAFSLAGMKVVAQPDALAS